ncbi:uncharacterized protein LOC143516809 [Brachyhypopomus gauderio]|uniref:uncharacterized protein LOC143516809 n=1 Tax=Brachyhypopomus gauderio TaxID=698409 RepID=UPI004041FC4B
MLHAIYLINWTVRKLTSLRRDPQDAAQALQDAAQAPHDAAQAPQDAAARDAAARDVAIDHPLPEMPAVFQRQAPVFRRQAPVFRRPAPVFQRPWPPPRAAAPGRP